MTRDRVVSIDGMENEVQDTKRSSPISSRIAMKVLKQNCTGCRVCEQICSLQHERAINPSKSRVIVDKNLDDLIFTPRICVQCNKPRCVAACTRGALSQDATTRVISVNQELCDGCEDCVRACAFKGIRYSEEMKRLYVCDQCDGRVLCARFCSTAAIQATPVR